MVLYGLVWSCMVCRVKSSTCCFIFFFPAGSNAGARPTGPVHEDFSPAVRVGKQKQKPADSCWTFREQLLAGELLCYSSAKP